MVRTSSLALLALSLVGCAGKFTGEPWRIASERTESVHLVPIDVTSAAATPEAELETGTAITAQGTNAFQWVEEPRIVHFNEPNLIAPSDPERVKKLGLGYAVRFSTDAVGSRSLLIMLEGGNGCISEAICARTANPKGLGSLAAEGVVDVSTVPASELPLEVLRKKKVGNVFASDLFQDVPENPFAHWNYVFLPYLSGDNWMGDNDGDIVFYDRREDTIQVVDASEASVSLPRPLNADGSVDVPQSLLGERYRFRGRANIRAILARLVPSFPDVERIVIAGYSAGGLGAELNFDRITWAFRKKVPSVRTALLADSGFWTKDQLEPVSTSSALTGFAPCLQKRLRDLFRFDRGLPSGCTGCFNADGRFSQGLMEYLAKTYPSSAFGLIASPGDETMQAVIATGKVAKNADGQSVSCGRIDYAPGVFDVGFYGVPQTTMSKMMVTYDSWMLDTLGVSKSSVLQVTPNPNHPFGKGAKNHVWMVWPNFVLDITQTQGCSPPSESCGSGTNLLTYLTSFVDSI